MQWTGKLKYYMFKFSIRISLFVGVFCLYLKKRDWLEEFMVQPFWHGFTLVHLIWFVFMYIMLTHLLPNKRLSMAWRKAKESVFVPVEGYDELELLKYVQKQNVAAWQVMLVWLCFNAIWGILYLVGILNAGDLLMLTVFYFLCDFICIFTNRDFFWTGTGICIL